MLEALRLTERIWLRAFGTPPKSSFVGLQIRSERYTQLTLNIRIEEGRSRILKTANARELPFPDNYFDATGSFCLCVSKNM